MTALEVAPPIEPVIMESAMSPPSTDGEVPRIPSAQPSRPEVIVNGTSGVHNHATSSTDIETAVEDAFKLSSQYGYKPRRLKVFTIGAGFSGLLIAHKLQHRFPEMQDMVDHTIFEALPEVGGTWYMNDYPGVQCDVPAHIYVSLTLGYMSFPTVSYRTPGIPIRPQPELEAILRQWR